MTTLMNDLGLSRYCVDIRNIEASRLTEIFAELTANQNEIKARMVDSLAFYRAELCRQFDELFPGRQVMRTSA